MALLRVDPGLVIWLWITFGIILVVLRLTVWDRIVGGLDKRSQRIASDLDSARKAGEKPVRSLPSTSRRSAKAGRRPRGSSRMHAWKPHD